MYCGNPTKVLRAINKLLKTETVALQRKFIHFRGLYLLERCLAEHINTKSIIKHNILLVLQMLPISTKNAIVKLESMVQQMTSAENFGFSTAELAKKILESWAGLELVYKIPKRIKGDAASEQETSGSTSISSIGNELKRSRSEDDGDRALKYQRSASKTPPDAMGGFSSNIQLPEVSAGVVFKEVEIKRLDVSWNQIITKPEAPALKLSTEVSSASISSSRLTESSIEQMVEAAQEASRLRQEALKKKQLDDLEEQKKQSLAKKKMMKERKEKQRELSQSLGKKLVEKAFATATPKPSSSSKSSAPSSSSSKQGNEKESPATLVSEDDKAAIKKLVNCENILVDRF